MCAGVTLDAPARLVAADFYFTLHPLRERAGQTLAVIRRAAISGTAVSGTISSHIFRLVEACGMNGERRHRVE